MKMKRVTPAEWLEFWASGIPGIDWYYTLAYKTTAVERKLFPAFCKRSKRDLVISTAEHLIYFAVGLWAALLLDARLAVGIGALVILTVIPAEFIAYHHFVKLFKGLRPRLLALAAAWNTLNVLSYWTLGVLTGSLA